MPLGRLADLDQYAVTTLGMYKNDSRSVRSRRRRIREKLVALFAESCYVCIDIVRAEAQMV